MKIVIRMAIVTISKHLRICALLRVKVGFLKKCYSIDINPSTCLFDCSFQSSHIVHIDPEKFSL